MHTSENQDRCVGMHGPDSIKDNRPWNRILIDIDSKISRIVAYSYHKILAYG